MEILNPHESSFYILYVLATVLALVILLLSVLALHIQLALLSTLIVEVVQPSGNETVGPSTPKPSSNETTKPPSPPPQPSTKPWYRWFVEPFVNPRTRVIAIPSLLIFVALVLTILVLKLRRVGVKRKRMRVEVL